MRVLHVIPSLDQRDGGPSMVLPLMARSLVMQGMDVDVVATMTAADAERQDITFEQPVQQDGFTVRYFKRQTKFYKVSLPLRRWLRAHARNYDLLHNHALFSFAPLVGAAAARHARIPYIMRPLGLLNTWGMNNRRRLIKALSFRCLDRPALEHAATIHYTSVDEAREAGRLGLRSRAVVIPLGIDLAPFRQMPGSGRFFEQFPQTCGRQIILFLSRIDPKKGIEVLLQALTRLEPTESDPIRPNPTQSNPILVIAGSGDTAYVASLKGLVVALGLEQNVIWTGFLEGADKLAALAAADLFVLPSYSENFGIALLEAMAAGLPCICSDQVALAMEPGNENAVCVTACDPEALSRAISRLLGEDTAARRKLGEGAREVVRQRYSLEAMGRSLGTLYHELHDSR